MRTARLACNLVISSLLLLLGACAPGAWRGDAAASEMPTPETAALAMSGTPSAVATLQTPALAPTSVPSAAPTADPQLGGINVADLVLTGPDEGWAVANPWQRGGSWPLTTGVLYRLTAGRWDPVPGAPIVPGPYACYTALSLGGIAGEAVWAVGMEGGLYSCSHGGVLVYRHAGQWEAMTVPSDKPFHAVDAAGPGQAWAGGDGFYRFTPDTGWQRVEAGDALPLIRPETTDRP